MGILTVAQKRYLLRVARFSIESAVGHSLVADPGPSPEIGTDYAGVFVTLHEGGELRGCIGYTERIKSLPVMVGEVAVLAAIEDPRFSPVGADEIDNIDIEISVLSPMTPVRDISEIEVGKHGLLLEWRGSRGLLLPQVPSEYGWDRETFLNQTARKAGLSPDTWKLPDAKLSLFSAEIFGEHALMKKN